MKTKIYAILAMPILLAACSNDNDPAVANDSQTEITLTATKAAQSRGYSLDTEWADGEIVFAAVFDATTNDRLYERFLKPGVDGSLTIYTPDFAQSFADTRMYYPVNDDPVLIRAIAYGPGGAASAFTAPGLVQTLSIEADQSGKANYTASDVCYAVVPSQLRTSKAVNLDFKHLLAKIEVTVSAGNGDEGFIAGERQLSILNTARKSTMTLDGSEASATFSDYSEVGPISMTSDLADTVNEAVIIPQTVASGADFIELEMVAGGKFTYCLPQAMEFKSGYKYRFDITVHQTEIKVTYTISDWNTGDKVSTDVYQEDMAN